jgi:hypothetical protein
LNRQAEQTGGGVGNGADSDCYKKIDGSNVIRLKLRRFVGIDRIPFLAKVVTDPALQHTSPQPTSTHLNSPVNLSTLTLETHKTSTPSLETHKLSTPSLEGGRGVRELAIPVSC